MCNVEEQICFQELKPFREKVDDVLWNKVLTLKLGKNVYDEIQKELDKVFEKQISDIGG